MTDNGVAMLSEEQVLNALRGVSEPATGRSLVVLRLVPDVRFHGRDVQLTIELLSPIRSTREKIERDVRAALGTIGGVGQVAIDWRTKVRPSGGGRSDAQPIQGVKNTIAVASGPAWSVKRPSPPGPGHTCPISSTT